MNTLRYLLQHKAMYLFRLYLKGRHHIGENDLTYHTSMELAKSVLQNTGNIDKYHEDIYEYTIRGLQKQFLYSLGFDATKSIYDPENARILKSLEFKLCKSFHKTLKEVKSAMTRFVNKKMKLIEGKEYEIISHNFKEIKVMFDNKEIIL